jgi:hypothetical protein
MLKNFVVEIVEIVAHYLMNFEKIVFPSGFVQDHI